MKFAIFNGKKCEAIKGGKANCPVCGAEMIPKCGEIKVHHWAHKGRRECDQWWENETEWHRAWKNRFPVEWQEIVHTDSNGEKHIADVKTSNNWIIEFQHSHLQPDERRSRNVFYGQLIWVVHGTRRKSDPVEFTQVINNSRQIGNNRNIRIAQIAGSKLLQEWKGTFLVFFDFDGNDIWWRAESTFDGLAYLMPFSRENFVNIHLGSDKKKFDEFNKFVQEMRGLIRNYELSLQRQRNRR